MLKWGQEVLLVGACYHAVNYVAPYIMLPVSGVAASPRHEGRGIQVPGMGAAGCCCSGLLLLLLLLRAAAAACWICCGLLLLAGSAAEKLLIFLDF